MASAGKRRETHVMLGIAARPHGIRGELKVHPHSGDPNDFLGLRRLLLRTATGRERDVEVSGSRVQGHQAVLTLDGVGSREDAQALTGMEVWASKADLPELDQGQHYWHQLEGMLVLARDGSEIGRVDSLMATGASDLLVVRQGRREVLIPMVDGIVVAVDDHKRQVIVDPPPGLLELND